MSPTEPEFWGLSFNNLPLNQINPGDHMDDKRDHAKHVKEEYSVISTGKKFRYT